MDIAAIVEEFSARHPEAPAMMAEDRGKLVLSLSGSFDMKLSGEVEAFLSSVIDCLAGGQILVVDLASVNYISSTGIGALVAAMVKAQGRSLPFLLRGMTDKVRAVFDMLGLLPYFPEDRDGA